MISTVSFSIVEENYGFIKLTYVKSQTCNLTFLCCFLTNCKKYWLFRLFRNSPIQRNIRKRNQSLGNGNRFRYIIGHKTSFEMSEGLKMWRFLCKANNEAWFPFTANSTTTTQKQSDYVVELSSLPLIALFWLKIGRCRGRNRLYGKALVTTKVQFWWVV